MNKLTFLACNLILFSLMACSAQKAATGSSENSDPVFAKKAYKLNQKEQRNFTDIFEYLRVKVPGIRIDGNQITLRGLNSVNAQGTTLVLVDGVELQDLSVVNPQEIESVEVIKDGAATIYGFRGVNGVIKITTKGGHSE